MTEYVIEKGVAAPGASKSKVLRQMDVGDSVLFANTSINTATSLTSLVTRQSDSTKRFTTRQADGGVRVWRIA